MRRCGNLNFTCCGTVRQPGYRLENVFPATGSRKTRQPRYKNNNKQFLDRGSRDKNEAPPNTRDYTVPLKLNS